MRGLQYSGSFRTICKSSANGSNGTLVWKENWIPFLEGMIQMYVFGNAARNAQVPIKIGKIIINLKLHEETIKKSNGKHCIRPIFVISLNCFEPPENCLPICK